MESERERVCNCCDVAVNRSCTRTWFRSVKRKLDELEIETRNVLIPGLSMPEVARVGIENECGVLREMVTNQQQSIHDLAVELEEERDASSSAANEAMSMILRLQREKAGIEMEARQFKRFSEQKSSHDQQELAALEELLYKREQTIQSLTCEVQAYKYRMMSYGLTEAETEGVKSVITHSNSIAANSETEFNQIDEYPPLKCNLNEQQQQTYPESVTETIDTEKYSYTETTCSIKDIEQRINQLEQSPHHQPILDKVIVGHSPRKQSPHHQLTLDKVTVGHSPRIQSPHNQLTLDKVTVGHSPRIQSPRNQLTLDKVTIGHSPRIQSPRPQPILDKVTVGHSPRIQSPRPQPIFDNVIIGHSPRKQSPRYQPVLDKVIVGHSPRKQNPSTRFSFDSTGSFFATVKVDDSNFKKVESCSEFGSETSDKIYTVDSIHYREPVSYHNDPKADTESYGYASTHKDSASNAEFQDPEVMKLYARLQALEADRESMRQAIISMRTDKAQLVLLKEIAQNLCKDVSPTSRMPSKKQSYIGSFGRSVASLVLWRRNASQAKYMFGMTASNPGLMVALNKVSDVGQWRCVSKTQL